MLDATQLSYFVTVEWHGPPSRGLGEELSSKATLHIEFLDSLSAPELVELLTRQAIDAWRWAIEQRMGKPPPNDVTVAVTLTLDAATGRPIPHLCTMVEDEADGEWGDGDAPLVTQDSYVPRPRHAEASPQ